MTSENSELPKDEHVAWGLAMALPVVGGGTYVYTGVWKWWLGGVLMSAGYIMCARNVTRPRTKVYGYEITAELSAFLIATQLKKILWNRYPVSFLIAGLGSLGVGYYGDKYYRAVLKGEHVRRFIVKD